MTILELKKLTSESAEPQQMEVHAQARGVVSKLTQGGKSYWQLDLADATGDFTMRVWDNHPAFAFCGTIKQGEALALAGWWKKSDFGLESDRWTGRRLDEPERRALLAGSAELQARQQRDWEAMGALVSGMADGPWKSLSHLLMTDFEALFRRAAAARGNHHARRGGLVEHTAQMMRAAAALCDAYRHLAPELVIQRDLVLAGVLFHDCGKMWENQYEEEGFEMPFTLPVECCGHILIGAGVAQALWRKLDPAMKKEARPLSLLLHLIASHHGTLEWGSPVEPKCPEAVILHYVDNLDAKIEMMRAGYATAKRVGDGVLERGYPLRVNLISSALVL